MFCFCRIYEETERDMSEDVYELMGYDKENKKVITASTVVPFSLQD